MSVALSHMRIVEINLVRFYIVAILFILFDIEIIFLLPWCVSIHPRIKLLTWSMIEFGRTW
jgi:NADH:ubiquinone oxidoreductase subunit 3 (subunit A)